MKKEVFDNLMEVGNEEVQQFLKEACPEYAGPDLEERDQWFLSVLKDLRVREITDAYITWVNSKGEWVFQDEKKETFWCSWDKAWSILETKYGMEYFEIQEYIKDQLLIHLNWKVETPINFDLNCFIHC